MPGASLKARSGFCAATYLRKLANDLPARPSEIVAIRSAMHPRDATFQGGSGTRHVILSAQVAERKKVCDQSGTT